MTSLPQHKPIHIHSFIYYTSLMLLNFHSLATLTTNSTHPTWRIMVANYAITAWLAAAGGLDRARRNPLLPIVMGIKLVLDGVTNVELAREEWSESKAFCEYLPALRRFARSHPSYSQCRKLLPLLAPCWDAVSRTPKHRATHGNRYNGEKYGWFSTAISGVQQMLSPSENDCTYFVQLFSLNIASRISDKTSHV